MEFFQTYGTTILMVVGLVVVFYLMYRSNKKQEKETQNMRDSLEVGDEITTIGGICGTVVSYIIQLWNTYHLALPR